MRIWWSIERYRLPRFERLDDLRPILK